MGKVKSIIGNEVVVFLLEFNEKEVKVFNFRERYFVVGRIMLFCVLDDSNKVIFLSFNFFCFEDRMICECEYLKVKYVQRVFFSVVDDKVMNFKVFFFFGYYLQFWKIL